MRNDNIQSKTESSILLQIDLKQLENDIILNPRSVKKQIDDILKNISSIDFNRIELLRIKAKTFSILGEVPKILDIFDEIDKALNENIFFTDDEEIENNKKNKIRFENYKLKIELILTNIWKIYDEKGEIIPEKQNYFETLIENETNNIIKFGEIGEGYFDKYIFQNIYGDKNKAEKHLEAAAINGHEEAIYAYTEKLEDDFLKLYNKLNTKEEKDKFLKIHLEDFETKYYQFVYEKIENDDKLISEGNKELYGNLGLFYEKIGNFSGALNSYTEATQNSKFGYKFYKNIGNLFLNNKDGLNFFDSGVALKNALFNFEILKNLSHLNNDIENTTYALEKLGDLNTDEDLKRQYYYEIIQLFNQKYLGNEKIVLRFFKAVQILGLKIEGEEMLYYSLANIDSKYLLLLANYYEEQGNIEYAFYNYSKAYILGVSNANKSLAMFVEINSKKSIIKDYDFSGENFDLCDKKTQKELVEINIIIDKLDKNMKLSKNDIKNIFEKSLGDNFYKEMNSQKITSFIQDYQNEKIYSDIYLHTILKNMVSLDGNINVYKNLLNKIQLKKKLDEKEISDILTFINLPFDLESESNIDYTQILNDIHRKSKK